MENKITAHITTDRYSCSNCFANTYGCEEVGRCVESLCKIDINRTGITLCDKCIDIMVDTLTQAKQEMDSIAKKEEGKTKMSKTEFYNYIQENFTLDGTASRLVDNILEHAVYQGWSSDELHGYLTGMLDRLGLSDKEIRMADF